jgi:hypothetical protein
MAVSRQQIVTMLRRAGMEDAVADALAILPDQVGASEAMVFCTEHGLSKESLVDRMGGSP